MTALSRPDPADGGPTPRDDVVLAVAGHARPTFSDGLGDDGQLLSVAIATTDAKALFLEHPEAGAEFQERLQAKPWGADEFVIRDPDGNLIVFGWSPAEPASS